MKMKFEYEKPQLMKMKFKYEKPQLMHHISVWQVWGESLPECYDGTDASQSEGCATPEANDF